MVKLFYAYLDGFLNWHVGKEVLDVKRTHVPRFWYRQLLDRIAERETVLDRKLTDS